MSARVLIVNDDELLLIVSWGEVARSASSAADLPSDILAHDFEEDDEELLKKIEATRLR